MRYLGIDYGTKKVGLALSDATGRFATPYAVWPSGAKLVAQVAQVCRSEQVGQIVIGESLNYHGQPNPVMKRIIPFQKTLAQATGLPIALVPEVLTTVQANQITGPDAESDARAAALILQTYLDRHHAGMA